MTKAEMQTLIDEAGCLLCAAGASPAQLIIIALLFRIVEEGAGGGGAGSVGVVDPGGVVTATAGSTYYNTANQTFWVNTDGGTTWTQLI